MDVFWEVVYYYGIQDQGNEVDFFPYQGGGIKEWLDWFMAKCRLCAVISIS